MELGKIGFCPFGRLRARQVGTGVGSELRHPLGITMVGGLILSQALTLFTTPVIYLWFDRLARRVSGQGAAGSRAGPLQRGRP